ncbi:MAG: polysaccharide pyruvyl transferase family protein [Clostridiales bacterium]|nr:polysaccharide pyruvyl transferase family protein [Clostridiales bacterium]
MKNVKIAGLTFHNSSNYGAVLQTFALQHAMEQLGYDYTIIDYANPEKYRFDSLLGKAKNVSLKNYLVKLYSLRYNYRRKRKFVAFSGKYLHITPKRYKNPEELREIGDAFDRYFCGSDQVWNAEMIRYDRSYFLDFVKDKTQTASYAASMGLGALTDRQKEFYSSVLPNVNQISVREPTAAQLISGLTGQTAQAVLDPTLLLTPKQWCSLFTCEVPKEPYIFTYCLRYQEEMAEFIRRLQEQTGLRVVGFQRGTSSLNLKHEIWNCLPSPEEFVSLIANARFVVTNSFHGTAFSSNLGRTFYTFVEGKGADGTNSRIYDYLHTIGLENRLYTACPEGTIDVGDIDYTTASQLLMRQRENAFAFIKSAVEGMPE